MQEETKATASMESVVEDRDISVAETRRSDDEDNRDDGHKMKGGR